MIVAWMFSATLLALLLGVAALAAERALRIAQRAGRWPWTAALLAALAWPPLAAPLTQAWHAFRAAPIVIDGGIASMSAIVAAQLPSFAELWMARVNSLLLALWAVASAIMLARLFTAARALRSLERQGRAQELDGEPVLVTESLGPAVVGILAPRIAVPKWLMDLDTPLRALVLRHEREHCRMRDPQLMWLSALAVALMPWNAGIWWMARRLRLALEIDCDVRTLASQASHDSYGKLLLLIAQRQSGTHLAPMLAESNSHLSQRIKAMQRTPTSRPLLRVLLFGAVATGALVLACSPRLATDLTSPKAVARPALTKSTTQGDVYFEFQVEKPVVAKNGGAFPAYPVELKAQGIEGKVLVQYVVDTLGVPEPGTFKVLQSSRDEFTQAVRVVLPNMRFTPAMVGDRPVKQLVQQPFVFAQNQSTPPAFQLRDALKPLPGNQTPRYPAALKAAGVEGSVVAQFIVDAEGIPDVRSLKVLRSSDPAFTDAVREVLPSLRYEAPQVNGRAVRRLIEVPFTFSLTSSPPAR